MTEIRRNARDLRQGVVVNALGYTVRPLIPLLMIVVVRYYGAAQFGLFTLYEALLLMLMRVCLLGFDQSLIWWVPQHSEANSRSQIRPTLLLTGLTSVTVATLLVAYPPAMAMLCRCFSVMSSSQLDAASALESLRIMAFAFVPMCLSEILICAVVGRRRLQARVFIKETLVPVSFLTGSIALYFLGSSAMGLAYAFAFSQILGLVGNIVAFQISFKRSQWPEGESWIPNREIFHYSWPMCIAQGVDTLIQRMDLLALSAIMTDPAVIGIYVVIQKLASVVREFRATISSIVIAISSKAAANRDYNELAAGYSYSTAMLIIVQLPILAVLAVFGTHLLGLYGPEFPAHLTPLLILSGCWFVNGVLGNAELVLKGVGFSRLTMLTIWAAMIVEGIALYFLVPRFGLIGAAGGVAVGWTFRSVLQNAQLRLFTGSFHLTRAILQPCYVTAGAFLTIGLARWFLGNWSPWTASFVTAAAFLLIYLPALYAWWKAGILHGTSPLYARAHEQESSPPGPHRRDQVDVAVASPAR